MLRIPDRFTVAGAFGTSSEMSQINYRELIVWQKARALTRDVYLLTQRFPRDERFGITSQMRRAALSILSNIAEGSGRWTRRDYRHFLLIARGSAFELDAQCVVANDIGYIDEPTAKDLSERVAEVAKMLNGLLRFLQKRIATKEGRRG